MDRFIDQSATHSTPNKGSRKFSHSFAPSSIHSPTPIRVRKTSINVVGGSTAGNCNSVPTTAQNNLICSPTTINRWGVKAQVTSRSQSSTCDNSLNSSVFSVSAFSVSSFSLNNKHKKSFSTLDLPCKEYEEVQNVVSKSAYYARRCDIDEEDDIYVCRPQNPQIRDDLFQKMDFENFELESESEFFRISEHFATV